MNIIDNRTSNTVIVVADHAHAAEVTAAQELVDHLQKMTGVRLPTNRESEYTSGAMISIGFTSVLPAALKRERFGKLTDDEILIWSHGDVLLLAGGSPRGTLYAVYEWLHQLGVRFYSEKFTKIPAIKRIQMPRNYRYRPVMRARSILVGNAGEAEWSARNRLTSIALWRHPGEKYGDGCSEGPDMHTFWRQVPVDVLKEHPEWCAEVDGRRMLPAGNNNWGMCLQAEARAYLVARGMEYTRQHPEVNTVWMSFNDGSPYCSCPKCCAFYEAHGGAPSSLVLQLANEMADALAAEFPKRMVKTLAYSWSLTPPQNIRARKNVTVMFCAMANYYIPLASGKQTEQLRAHAAGWKRVCDNLAVYLYAYPPEYYWYPAPCLYLFGQNIKWAQKIGCNDLFMQVSGFGGSYGSDGMDLRAWVYSRMMWDPKQSFEKLVEEFARDNYGAAYSAVMKALERDRKVALGLPYTDGNENRGLVAPDFVSPKQVRESNLMLERASNLLQDTDQKNRLDLFRLAYLWADVWSGFDGGGKYDPARKTWSVPMTDGAVRNRFAIKAKQIMIDHGVNGLREGVSLNPHSLGIDKMGVDYKAVRLSDNNTSVVVVPEIGGNLYEFKATGSDFTPLKDVWMMTIGSYPLHCSWRDIINGDYVSGYTLVGGQNESSAVIQAQTQAAVVKKMVSVADGWCSVRLEVNRTDGAEASIRSSLMLDMLPSVLGDSPVVYVEVENAAWMSLKLGEGLGDFWYAYGGLNRPGMTGRIIIASGTRAEGVMIAFAPKQQINLGYEYDRYDYPHGYGHMLDISLTNPNRTTSADSPLVMEYRVRILPSVRDVVEGK